MRFQIVYYAHQQEKAPFFRDQAEAKGDTQKENKHIIRKKKNQKTIIIL